MVNGRAYRSTYAGSEGDPFYINRAFQKADIEFNNCSFKKVDCLYDLYNDLLLIPKLERGVLNLVALSPKLVEHFTIGDYTFHYLDIQHDRFDPGFYLIPYQDQYFTLYHKMYKTYSTSSAAAAGTFSLKQAYLVRVGNSDLIWIRNRRTLKKVFSNADKDALKSLRGFKPDESHQDQLIRFLKKVK